MTPQFVIQIIGQALMTAFFICAPILVIAFVLGLFINLIQIATSLQDPVFSTVPRLAAALAAMLLLLPWMLHTAMAYAISLFGNLPVYAR